MPHQPRVLVVDDDQNILSAFEGFLKKEHCSMVSASTAEEAFTILSHQMIHLLITDVRMKWESGVTLLMKVKQRTPTLPVIVITGYPNLITEPDIRRLGADFYLVKPLELDQLRHAVRACLHLPGVSVDARHDQR